MDELEFEIGAVAGATEGTLRFLADLLRRKQRKPVPGLGLPPRNPGFTGRDEQLRALHQALVSGRGTRVPLVISGLGGIGKTQLAVEYCYRHLDDFPVIWWLRAAEPATLAADFAALALRLGLPEKDAQDQSLAIDVGRAWLERSKDWLLVFDNAPNPAGVRDYVPRAGPGCVIITSRHQAWSGVAAELQLPSLSRSESVEFVLKRTRTDDKVLADRLAEALGDLPLALEQAAAYVVETSGTITRYLELLSGSRRQVLSWRSQDAEYPDPVATAWEVSFRRLEKESRVGAALLNLAAFLAPDKIPLDLLLKERARLPAGLVPAATDPIRLDKAKAALIRLSLARFEGNDMTVHRLVQAVARDRMRSREKAWAGSAAKLLNHVYPFDSDEVRCWPECARLLSHALEAAANAEALNTAIEPASEILNQAGMYLRSRGRYAEAEPLYRRALSMMEKSLGPVHPDLSTFLNNFALLYHARGRYAEAEPLYRRSLAIDEKVLGPGSSDVATDLNNLAELYRIQGRYAEAEPLFQRSLAILEKTLGPDHPTVAVSLNNLAVLCQAQGRNTEAEPLYQRSLAIREKTLGPEHPEVAASLNNLARLHCAQGRHEQAGALFQRSLAILEQTLGPDHPSVATSLHNLAELHLGQGRHAQAEPLFRRSLAIREKALGPEHPETAACLASLARLCQATDRAEEAEALERRAERIRAIRR